MRWTTIGVLLVAALGAIPAAAQDMFPNVEYIAGRAGMEDKKKGTLLVGDTELRLADKKGETILAVPLATITEVSNSTERKDAGFAKKAAFGIFAGSKKEDFVVIASQTATDAEALIFKIHEKNVAPGLVAKLKFRLGKLRVGADSTGGPKPSNPPPSR